MAADTAMQTRPGTTDPIVARPDPTPRGFRPVSRRRTRLAAGLAIAAVAVVANIAVYSSLGGRVEVVQVVSSVRAGEPIERSHLRLVEIDVDGSQVPIVAGSALASVVGQYAVTYLPSGALLTADVIQPDPLVTPGASVVAVSVDVGRMPRGITNRSHVHLVLHDLRTATDAAPIVAARVVSQPDTANATAATGSLSVEVAAADAALVAGSDDVRVVLLDPGRDPVTEGPG